MKCAGSVPARWLPERRVWGFYPILVECSFESDCAFNSARARCMTGVDDAGARSPNYSRRRSMIVLQKSTQPIAASGKPAGPAMVWIFLTVRDRDQSVTAMERVEKRRSSWQRKVLAILRSLLNIAGNDTMWPHLQIVCGTIMTTLDVDHGLFRSTNRRYGVRVSIRFGWSCSF